AIGFHVQLALRIHRNYAKDSSSLLAQHLPRHDIRVMFHRGDDDFIAFMDKSFAITLRYHIYPFGSPFGNDYLMFMLRMDKLLDFAPRDFKCIRRDLRKIMHSTVYITVHVDVVIQYSVYHLLRLLCSRSIVQIDQRSAVDFSF